MREQIEGGGRETFEMIRVDEDGAHILLPPEFVPTQQSAGEILDAQTLCKRGVARRDALGGTHLNLDAKSALRLEQGARTVHMRWTANPRGKALVAGLKFDSCFAAYVGCFAAYVRASSGAALLMVVVLRNLPVEEGSLYGDRFDDSVRFAAISTKPIEEAPTERVDGESGEGETEAAERSEAGETGTTGINTASNTHARMQIKNRDTPPRTSREQVRARAAYQGILGLMSERQIFVGLA
ncbi:MAG: hypothetical protein GY811_07680 [Myxococcales bacterium]|nr:hypothetical protein [Myxococcales bacterium]